MEVESEVLATHSFILFVRARVDTDDSKLIVHEVLTMAAIRNTIVDKKLHNHIFARLLSKRKILTHRFLEFAKLLQSFAHRVTIAARMI